MTSEEHNRMEHLCQQIMEERNAARFDALVLELNNLLDANQHIGFSDENRPQQRVS